MHLLLCLLLNTNPPPPMAMAALNLVFRVLLASITCTGGTVIGIIAGAIKGQTSETGLVRGAAVGAVTGAIIALQAMDMIANGQPFSKVALLQSLLHGKIFIEWNNAMETSFTYIMDMENNETRGLSEDVINELPKRVFKGPSETRNGRNETNCVICLQDFENNEEGRELPSCGHVFHLKCINEWLIRQGSCPVCRRDVIG